MKKWTVYKPDRPTKAWFPGIDDEDGSAIVLFGYDNDIDDEGGVRGNTTQEALENAELIVKAVNCHDELVAMCRKFKSASQLEIENSEIWNQLDAVLAKIGDRHES